MHTGVQTLETKIRRLTYEDLRFLQDEATIVHKISNLRNVRKSACDKYQLL